jgi:hypothetical protein
MQRAWDKSVADPNAPEENGFAIAGDRKGNVLLVNPSTGEAGRMKIDPNVDAGLTYWGNAHTHPYSPKENGHVGVPFSAADIAGFVNNNHRIGIVQSGDFQFLMLRTALTPAALAVSKQDFVQSFNQSVADQMRNNGATFPNAVRASWLSTAKGLGIATYEGASGVYQRKD